MPEVTREIERRALLPIRVIPALGIEGNCNELRAAQPTALQNLSQ